jgi:probable rRNA maturation factor
MSGEDPASRHRPVTRRIEARNRRESVAGRAALRRQPPVALNVTIVDALGRPIRVPGLGRWLARVAPLRVPAAANIALISDARVKALNRTYRGKDRVTDVLSFPAHDKISIRKLLTQRTLRRGTAPVQLGDVVIASGQARRQARQIGHSLGIELRVLALHGLLHLIGYDHHVDGGAMAALERALRRKGRLREGLIERAGGRLDGKPR